ncbi:MAG TPA: NAD+ synthase [Blastocatellia bacterium]|nr:NAD+ synthase [Blastocatellia bacterium]
MRFNEALTAEVLIRFIKDEIHKIGMKRAVLGLSGGIDSALVAYLAVKALGAENVFCVLMPYKTSSRDSITDARLVTDQLKVESTTIDISPIVDAYFEKFPEANALRRGNVMARTRMIALYDQSMARGALVLGTSNKTELLLGYGTIFGDLASAINPIGDLYKTEVRALSRHLGVPDQVVNKRPSADLWADQSDEADLGFTYEQVDKLLVDLVDRRIPPEVLIERGADEAFVRDVQERIRRSQFKRRPPIIAKVSSRSMIHDFKYLRDWGY